VTDDCIDDLMNIDVSYEISLACINLLTGVPELFVDPATGNKLEGVEIIEGDTPVKKTLSRFGF